MYLTTNISAKFLILKNSTFPSFKSKSATYLKAAGDTLHSNTAAVRICDTSLGIHLVRESITQSNGSKKHLNTDQKILVTCWHCSCTCGQSIVYNRVNNLCSFQNRQQYPYIKQNKKSNLHMDSHVQSHSYTYTYILFPFICVPQINIQICVSAHKLSEWVY